jgi:predicted nucleic acid-binding protein
MIVLDTNVVSEAMKPDPHPSVRDWLNSQASETLYLSSVTLAELLFGVAVLPQSKRKNKLEEAVNGLRDLFKDKILTFDRHAAEHYARLAVISKERG